jgi:hypothetical protein
MQLRKVGADLTQPRHVQYFLYFPTEEAARTALPEAAKTGLDVEIREPFEALPDKWLLRCQGSAVVLHPHFVRWIDDQLQGIADQHGGVYDGWEAAVQAR